jgi:hypothetical protein
MITSLIFSLIITMCRSTIVIDSIIYRSPDPKVFRNFNIRSLTLFLAK